MILHKLKLGLTKSPNERPWRFSLHIVLRASLVLLLFTGQRSWAADKEQPADLFKKFIESPPVIEQLLFEYTDTAIKGKRPVDYNVAKFQTNACFLRTYTSYSDMESESWVGADIISKFDNKYWRFLGGRDYLNKWTDLGKPEESENPVLDVYRTGIFQFAETMNMGIPYAEIGSIHWQGDQFEYADAIQSSQRKAVRLKGKLFRDSRGRAEKLKFHLALSLKSRSDLEADWQVDYEYRTNFAALPFLPSNLKIGFFRNGALLEGPMIGIRSWKVSQNPMPESAFNLDLLSLPGTTSLYVSNKALIYKNQDGKWAEVSPPNPKDFIKNRPPKK
ncbi:MAG: hypothetical protein JWM68_3061 [Verrucomicrobiales bacterium]|nr:hypothetical protein [Verrucomicrobiales bacterium]